MSPLPPQRSTYRIIVQRATFVKSHRLSRRGARHSFLNCSIVDGKLTNPSEHVMVNLLYPFGDITTHIKGKDCQRLKPSKNPSSTQQERSLPLPPIFEGQDNKKKRKEEEKEEVCQKERRTSIGKRKKEKKKRKRKNTLQPPSN
jgi:hypothetical protein